MFSKVNLPLMQKKSVSEQISNICDPISLVIPNDPVFIYYGEHLPNVRIFSKQTLISLQHLLKTSRHLYTQGLEDKSFIKLALAQHTPRNEEEAVYKELLLLMVEKNLNGMSLTTVCQRLDVTLFLLINLPLNLSITLQPINWFSEFNFIRNYIVRIHEIVRNRQRYEGNTATIEHHPISAFLEELILLQTGIIEENRKKLLSTKGEILSLNQILCPYTRYVIDVEKTLATINQANLFLKLVVALAMLTDLKDAEIDSFLQAQPPNYLQNAYKELKDYIENQPNVFTLQQQKFLADMGILDIIKQTRLTVLNKRYQHLWNEANSFKDNTLAILNDYSKLTYPSPQFQLFITGHWARHHHVIVKKAIEQIEEGIALEHVLANLRAHARCHPGFDPKGSLARRLEFIDLHSIEPLNTDTNCSIRP
ncbi:Uncharacterised protein [Legionella beliardensis]|uniref:RavJ-like C-terminal domain-containing protein n=1 Tax=Legionella beliardensis TaxID=91822 RepID=A0A378I0I6_9GAMM|nr:DUF5617 domain-containing protein [Legionella beliardensis]STX28096.1 Uncharacterised protein [Legionella beliardensis]